jgi:hypothetical protein
MKEWSPGDFETQTDKGTTPASATDDSIIDLDEPIVENHPGRNRIVKAAKFLNVLFLILLFGFMLVVIAESRRSEALPIVLGVALVAIFPIVNLLALQVGDHLHSWLYLYFKRRKLEEQKRIRELERELS